jgi:carboxyl-terminal processing protease
MRLMKAVIIIAALVIMLTMALQARSQSTGDIGKIIDVAIEKARGVALNSGQVKWDSIRVIMHETSKNATSVPALKASLEIMLASMNDREANFFNPNAKTVLAGNSHQEVPFNHVSKTNQPVFYFATLENNVRYLRIAAIPASSDVQKQAQEIRVAVDSLSKDDASQWVVDLRYASGGEMKPLFAGLAPLLDEGLAATAVDNKNNIVNMYTVHNGNFYIDQVPVVKFPISNVDLRKAKIAVLTSHHTSGATELLSIALKGRKNTRFFGEPTAGQIFGVTTIQISKELAMQLANTMYVDKKGNDYKHEISPDTSVEFTDITDLNYDHAIMEATLWLNSLPESVVRIGMN